jgi:hypothetical protein
VELAGKAFQTNSNLGTTPIYDVVFKRRMDVAENTPETMTFLRLDFLATIKTATGDYQKIPS